MKRRRTGLGEVENAAINACLVVIPEHELEIHAWPPERCGVLVIHVPTQVAVVEASRRSQLQNRAVAIARLRWLLSASDATAEFYGQPPKATP